MTDFDAETAFLNGMRGGASEEYEADEEVLGERNMSFSDSDEDYDPSDLITDITLPTNADDPAHAPQSTVSPAPTQNLAGIDQVSAADGIPSPGASRSPSTIPMPNGTAKHAVKQPRTMGGFIVDDDEDEEVQAQTSTASDGHAVPSMQRVPSHTPQRSISQTPSNTVPSMSKVSILKAANDEDPTGAMSNSLADAVSNFSTFPPNTGAPSGEDSTTQSSQVVPVGAPSKPAAAAETEVSLPKARLPHDRVGILEDRIKEDPRGDLDAWLNLIAEHRKRNKLDDARNVYERFFKVFPTAAEQWVAYANMELENNDSYRVEQIFNKSLMSVPHVELWSIYLNYVRRRNNITTDSTGDARKVVAQSFDFVLQNVGIDKDSGQLWLDYVQFIRSGPGTVGGNNWQDQQKMDLLRKTYRQAICIPTQAVNTLWKEYDAFERGLNKITGPKFLQEKSKSYMTARSCNMELRAMTRELDRTTLPRLPPAMGFEGDVEYIKQVELWKKWIDWEKDDSLVLKEEDVAAYRARVIYVYKQALMALRFWPHMWFDAAEFCFENDLETQGNEFLSQGVAANPESCLLAFKRADRIESTTSNEGGEEGMKRRGTAVREPYNKVLDALYELLNQSKTRETQMIARFKETFAQQQQQSEGGDPRYDDDDEQPEETTENPHESAMKAQIEALQRGNMVQVNLLSRTISFAWIALMRAMRRIQGKGKPGDPIGGSRQVFADARKRGRLTSDVYVASALIEYHCYKDPAATKIFEKGMKLFPNDEYFALEYLKHLIAINDVTNARAVFETTVNRLAQKPETLHKAKPIYAFFHEYEAHYGELNQITKLEKRMADLFPEDPQLSRFSHRFSIQGFDPTAIRHIISPNTQAKPKALPTGNRAPSLQNSPRPPPISVQLPGTEHSPKRPLQLEDSDNELGPPRKFARSDRGESPLKGAAGRRLDAARRNAAQSAQQSQARIDQIIGQSQQPAQPPAPVPLPREISFLLSIIPPAESYNATIFKPDRMVELLRKVDMSRPNRVAAPSTQAPTTPHNYGQINIPYQYGRQ